MFSRFSSLMKSKKEKKKNKKKAGKEKHSSIDSSAIVPQVQPGVNFETKTVVTTMTHTTTETIYGSNTSLTTTTVSSHIVNESSASNTVQSFMRAQPIGNSSRRTIFDSPSEVQKDDQPYVANYKSPRISERIKSRNYPSPLAPIRFKNYELPISPIKKNFPQKEIENVQMKPNITKKSNELNNLIQIAVKSTGRRWDQSKKVPVYQTFGKTRGSVLLINNITFDKNESSYRKGAEIDEINIENLFKSMKFSIDKKTNLTADEMLQKIKKYKKQDFLKSVDINVVIMMSHGHGNKSGSTQIAGTDNNLVHTSDIIEMFSNNNCPNLANKPKIFIFQCCRGDDNQKVETDSAYLPAKARKDFSDMLLCFSTIPGYVSHRDPKLGTWYIQAICKVFMEHAHDTHVEDLLKIVDHMLMQVGEGCGYAQTTSYENRGFKLCYLHP